MFHTGGDCVACQPLLFPTVYNHRDEDIPDQRNNKD